MTATSLPRLITIDKLLGRIPYSRVHLWRLENAGQFPKRVRLSPNKVAWLEDEIFAWLKERADARYPKHETRTNAL